MLQLTWSTVCVWQPAVLLALHSRSMQSPLPLPLACRASGAGWADNAPHLPSDWPACQRRATPHKCGDYCRASAVASGSLVAPSLLGMRLTTSLGARTTGSEQGPKYPYRNFPWFLPPFSRVSRVFIQIVLQKLLPISSVLDYLGTFLSYKRSLFTEFWRRKAPF